MIGRSYYIFLAVGVVLVTAILATYFVHSAPTQESNTETAELNWQYISVDSPLQPIPTVQNLDLDWVNLGRALFHSPLLSKDNTISCASCHLVHFGGDDSFPVSTGIENKVGTRNSPSVLNAVFNFRQFWDGRSLDLKEQIAGPVHNPVEMGSSWQEIVTKLENSTDFVTMFASVTSDGINEETISNALVAYETSLTTPNAPIDAYIQGDHNALNPQQKRGLQKFTDFGCVACHQGVNIGGNLFQKIGRIGEKPALLADDLGRYEVTGNEYDKYVFKVPSLRNVALTAPYFHNGAVAEFSDPVKIMAKMQLGRDISQSDIDDIVALLQSFTGDTSEL